MLDELKAVLSQVPADSQPEAYAAAIVEENCLGKQTAATRRHSLQHLRELYGLDTGLPLFRVLAGLWRIDSESHPLLALLCSLARDPLLRATSAVIAGMPPGAELSRGAMTSAVADSVHGRMKEDTIDKIVRNTSSTWVQSGHLVGRTFKSRRRVQATPGSVAFALLLARVAGMGVAESLTSDWVRVLDCSRSEVLELAGKAKRQGLIELRMAGDVIDMNLDRLDPGAGRSGRSF